MTRKRKTRWTGLLLCVAVAVGVVLLVRAFIPRAEPVPTAPPPLLQELTDERNRDDRVWREELPKALAGADRLVVSLGQSARSGSVNPVVVTGVNEVGEFLALIELAGVDDQCKCCGEVLFTFFKDGTNSAALTWHHGKRLRWWKKELVYDAKLTGKSRSSLAAWLKKKGYMGSGQWERFLTKEERDVLPPETRP